MKKLHGQYFSENSVLNAAVQEYARKFGKAPDKAAFMNMRAQFSKPVAAPQAKPTPKPAAGTVKAKGYTAADRAYFANPLGIRQPTTHKKAAPRAKNIADSLRGGIPVPEYQPRPMTNLEEDDIKAFSPSRQAPTVAQRASRSLLKFGTEQVESTGKGVKWIAGATGLHPSVMFEPIVAKQEEARKRILDDPENQAGASNLAMLGGGGAAFGIARIPAELGFGAYSAYATAKGIEDAGGIGNYLLDHTGEAGMNALGLLAGVHGHFGALKALEPRIGKALNAELARGRTPPVPPTMLGQSYRVPTVPDTARNASPIAPPVLRQPTRTRLAPVDRTPVVGGRVATAKAPVVLGSRTRTAKVAPVVEEPVAAPQVEAPVAEAPREPWEAQQAELDRLLDYHGGERIAEGDESTRVVFGVRKGQALDMNAPERIGYEDANGDLIGGLHTTGDTDYWSRQLGEDYEQYAGKKHRVIRIRHKEGDIRLDDPQFSFDPESGGTYRPDSNVFLGAKRKLIYGKDWVFEGEKFADEVSSRVDPWDLVRKDPEWRGLMERASTEPMESSWWDDVLRPTEDRLLKKYSEPDLAPQPVAPQVAPPAVHVPEGSTAKTAEPVAADGKGVGLSVVKKDRDWNVIHDASGDPVMHFSSKTKAEAALKQLNGVADWNLDWNSLRDSLTDAQRKQIGDIDRNPIPNKQSAPRLKTAPKKPTPEASKTEQKTTPELTFTDGQARYRGYWINKNKHTGELWISKDGFTLSHPKTIDAAIADIHALTGDVATTKAKPVAAPDGKAARPRARRKGQGGHFIAGVPNVKGITDWIPRKLNGKWLDPNGNEVPPHIMRLFEAAGALRGVPGYNGETFKETRTRKPILVNPKFQDGRRIVPTKKPAPVRVRPASTPATEKPPVSAQKPQPATSKQGVAPRAGEREPVYIKNAKLNEQRIAKGLEELDPPTRRTWEEAYETAKAKGYDKNAEAIVGRGDGLSDAEAAGVALRLTEMDNAITEAAAKGDTVTRDSLLQKYDEFTNALRRTKSETARALNSFKMAIDPDQYTLAKVVQAKTDTLGRTPNAKEMARLEEAVRKLQKLEERIPEVERENVRLREQVDRLAAEKAVRKEAINRNKGVKIERIRATREEAIKEFSRLTGQLNSGIDPQALYVLGKIAKSYAQEGVVNLDAIVQRVMVDVKGVTPEDVYRAINTPNPNPQKPSVKALQTRLLKSSATRADLEAQLASGKPRLPQKRVDTTVPGSELEKNQIAIRKARSEIRTLIEEGKPIRANLEGVGQVYDIGNNMLRTAKATADISATGRQGFILVSRDLSRGPSGVMGLSGKFWKSLKATLNENTFEQIQNRMVNDPRFTDYQRAGGHFSEIGGGGKLGEEMYIRNLGSKIPVVRDVIAGSERHMVSFLNMMRTDAFYKFMDANPNASAAELKGMADLVNVFSGRGNLGKAGAVSKVLGRAMFAPRFAVSRIEAPFKPLQYKDIPSVRNEAIKSLASTAALGGSIMALAALAGAEVTTDTKSSDWGKIKVGNTRFDVWAGMQQPTRLLMQSIMHNDFDAVAGTQRFISYKLAPGITTPLELRRERTITGQKTTRKETALKMAVPIAWTDVYEAYQDAGLGRATAVGAASALGIGASTYGPRTKKRAR